MNAKFDVQEIPRTEDKWLSSLVGLARFLRGPDGCPWDRKQTSKSFAVFVREEADELVEAIEEDANDKIEEEWGDTLFTLLACLAAAEEEGRFSLIHALEKTREKMVRRHGHIFGDAVAVTPDEVSRVWQAVKAQEKAEKNRAEKNREREADLPQ